MWITLATPYMNDDITVCWKDVDPSILSGMTIHNCKIREKGKSFKSRTSASSTPYLKISAITDEETTDFITNTEKHNEQPSKDWPHTHTVTKSFTRKMWGYTNACSARRKIAGLSNFCTVNQ